MPSHSKVAQSELSALIVALFSCLLARSDGRDHITRFV